MTVMVFKDGRIVTVEAGQPINIALEGLLALITSPQEGDVLTFDGSIWVNKQPETPETPEVPDDTEPAAEEET